MLATAVNHLPLQTGRCGHVVVHSANSRSRLQLRRDPARPQASLQARSTAASSPIDQPAARPAASCLLAAPAASSPAFPSPAVGGPCTEDGVSLKYRGLSALQLDQAFRTEHPGLLEALESAANELSPTRAARTLRRLERELPPVLTDVAPGGDCILVALAPGLLPLLESVAGCCEASLAAGAPQQAADTAAATLSMLSCLAFGSAASAAPYAAVGTRCKQALKAAFDAGVALKEEAAVDLYATCARSSPWLWLTPYFGHRCACAIDDFITQGWATGELAVGFAESYARLVGLGRLQQVEAKWVRVARAAMKHPLSLAHTTRLLAAAQLLPVEMRIQLALQARSAPSADWHAQLCAMHAVRQEEEAQARFLRMRGPYEAPASREPAGTQQASGPLAPTHHLHAARLARH
ncbi:hypothetical protein ABPG77_005549 [Micractinium sp. CCAP 211/92]